MLIDIIFILIVAVFIFIGWKRGFMLSVFSLVSTVVAIILASILSPVVSSWIESTAVAKSMETKFTSYVETALNESMDTMTEIEIEKAVQELPLPEFLVEEIPERLSDATVEMSSEAVEQISVEIGNEASKIVCGLIGFVVVFIIVIILLQIIKYVLKLTSNLPIIRQADKIGGIAFGFAEGVIFVMVVLLLVSVFSSMSQMQGLLNMIQESSLTKFAYENNFIGEIISNLL